MPLLLPPNPGLRHLRLQVDDLLKAFSRKEPDAIETIREYLPEALEQSSQPLKRAQAEYVLARQYGF